MRKWTLSEALSYLRFFKDIDKQSYKRLLETAQLTQYKRGEMVYVDGHAMENLFIVLEGQVSIYKLGRQGNKKIIFIHGDNAILNEEILQHVVSSVNAETMTQTTMLEIPLEIMIELMDTDNAFNHMIIYQMGIKIRQMYHQLKNTMSNESIDRRLAAKLYKLAVDHGEEKEDGTIEINLKLTGTALADMIGVSRETISRQMMQFKENGYIGRRNAHIYIKSLESLYDYFGK